MDESFDYAGANDTASETASDANRHHDQHVPPFSAGVFARFLPQHEDAEIGLRDDEELEHQLQENRLPSTNLEPVIERLNDLVKTQTEMMRVQREMMGVMFSLSMRMDSALAARSANTSSMKDIKGKGRQIDFKGEDDFTDGSQMVFDSSETNVHVFETVNFLTERISEVGKDVGLLLGHVLGTSQDADVASSNTQNPRKRRRVDSTTVEAGGSGSNKLSGHVTEPAQQSILNRLGSIESAVYELLEKVKDQEDGNNERLRQDGDQAPNIIPCGPRQAVIPEDAVPPVAHLPPADPAVVPPVQEAPIPAPGAQGPTNALGLNPNVAQPVNGAAGPQGIIEAIPPNANTPPGQGAAPGNQNPNPNANMPPGVAQPQVLPFVPAPGPPPAYSRYGLPPTLPWLTFAENFAAGMSAIPNIDAFLPNHAMVSAIQRQRATGLGSARLTTAYERFLQTLGDNNNNINNNNAVNGTNTNATVGIVPDLRQPVGGAQPANQQHAIPANHPRPMQRMVAPYRRLSGASYLPPHITGGSMHAQAGPSNLNAPPTGPHAPHQHDRLCMSSRSLWEDDDDTDTPDLLPLPPRGPWGF